MATAPPPLANPAAQVAHVEVDNDFENDSSYSESDSASTDLTSLSSSVVAYKWENGRRYHAFKEGQYLIPNDEQEMEREDMKHHWAFLIANDRLHLAPIAEAAKSGKGADGGEYRILDCGTGTGIWVIEMADLYPLTQITGADLSPIQPTWVPPNVSFEVNDVESDWVYGPASFDFIHVRFMAFAIRNWPRFLTQVYDALKPGAYLEIADLKTPPLSDDNSIPTPSSIMEFFQHLTSGALKAGLNVENVTVLREQLTAAGFPEAGIKHETFKLPIGGWPKDRRLKEAGVFEMETLRGGLQSIGMGFFTRVLGWSVEQVEIFFVAVRREFDDKRIHMWLPMHFFWVQKPLDP